jgi:hypothetical protein
VLSVKTIVLTFTIVSVTLLTQLFPMLNHSSLGDIFSFSQIYGTNLIQKTENTTFNRSGDNLEYLSRLSLKKKSPINKVKKHMKIKFRQSGGYAGLRMGCDLDTNSLSTAESTQLESLVKTSGILQARSGRSENAADLINYEITIETKDGIYQVKFDDLTLPESIIPLLDYLQNQAKPLK